MLSAGLATCVLTTFVLTRAAGEKLGVHTPGTGLDLVAMALLAVLVPLVRPRLELLSDRLAFGRDGDPYAVMAGFIRQITDALAIDEVLPHLARTAATAVHSPHGEVRLWLPDGSERRQVWPAGGAAAGEQVKIPLQHGGNSVGQIGIEVAADSLSRSDRDILDRLAGPAGLALANVRLTFDLRRRLVQGVDLAEELRLSRQRLLDAAAQERERFATAVEAQVQLPLERAGRALSAVDDPGALAEARAATQQALDALRDLAAGIFPAALSERGLADAVDLYVQRVGSPVDLRLQPIAGLRLPEPVEALAYFCAVALIDDLSGQTPAFLELTYDGFSVHVLVESPEPSPPETLLLLRDRIEARDGTIESTRRPATGRTTVTITLPHASEPYPTAAPSGPAGAWAGRP